MDPSDTDDDMDTRNRREWKQEQREHRRKCAVKHKWSKSLYEVNEGDSTSPVCLIPSSFPQVRNDLHANKDLAIKADRTLMWPNPFSHL